MRTKNHSKITKSFTSATNEYFENKSRKPIYEDDRKEVLAYHFRQAFKLGEVTPEQANTIGYETAMAITGNRHAFIVCTHNDKDHIHNHIIFLSVDLDKERKYHDKLKSHKNHLKELSDKICKKHGLSVIPDPEHGSSKYKPHRNRKGS